MVLHCLFDDVISQDMISFIVKMVVIPAFPKAPKAKGDDHTPSDPFIEAFVLYGLPSFQPVVKVNVELKLREVVVCHFMTKGSGNMEMEEDVVDIFFAIIKIIAGRVNIKPNVVKVFSSRKTPMVYEPDESLNLIRDFQFPHPRKVIVRTLTNISANSNIIIGGGVWDETILYKAENVIRKAYGEVVEVPSTIMNEEGDSSALVLSLFTILPATPDTLLGPSSDVSSKGIVHIVAVLVVEHLHPKGDGLLYNLHAKLVEKISLPTLQLSIHVVNDELRTILGENDLGITETKLLPKGFAEGLQNSINDKTTLRVGSREEIQVVCEEDVGDFWPRSGYAYGFPSIQSSGWELDVLNYMGGVTAKGGFFQHSYIRAFIFGVKSAILGENDLGITETKLLPIGFAEGLQNSINDKATLRVRSREEIQVVYEEEVGDFWPRSGSAYGFPKIGSYNIIYHPRKSFNGNDEDIGGDGVPLSDSPRRGEVVTNGSIDNDGNGGEGDA
ncbi:hypothetical protein KY284_007741 [Solanum tuberosum]|nr:hypothetical protein KY284_007741 [Solanum tuberosum]